MTEVTPFRHGQKAFLAGHLQESILAFSEAIGDGDEPLRALLARGVALLKSEQFAEAISDFSEVLSEGGDCQRAHFYRGICHLNLGHYGEAVADFDASLARNPERGSAYLARGLAHAELGNMAAAEADISNSYVLNNVEVGEFLEEFAISRTMFNRSMALFDGDRGPWRLVMTEEEVQRMEGFH